MKKLLAVVLGLGLISPMAMAFDTKTTYSSHTVGALSIRPIWSARTLETVIVSSLSANDTITIYDSSGIASNEIATIDLDTVNMYEFDLWLSSGLSYSTTGNSGSVTIIYTK